MKDDSIVVQGIYTYQGKMLDTLQNVGFARKRVQNPHYSTKKEPDALYTRLIHQL